MEEIREIFESAMEEQAAPGPDWEQEKENIRREARLDAEISGAVAGSGAHDGALLEMLLRQGDLSGGVQAAVEKLRQEKPWLFMDGGSRPRFSAETMERALASEEEQVARRYKGNPWYKRK